MPEKTSLGPPEELLFLIRVLDAEDAEVLLGRKLEEREERIPDYSNIIETLDSIIGSLQACVDDGTLSHRMLDEVVWELRSLSENEELKEGQQEVLNHISCAISEAEEIDELRVALQALSNTQEVYLTIERASRFGE